MYIYLAAAYQRQLEMRGVRTQLQRMGHRVTARWLDAERGVDGWSAPYIQEAAPALQADARRDMEDIERAQAVFSFTDGLPARGGRHVEFGYALALGKRLFVIGPREQLFHTLGRVIWYPDWDRLAADMATWAVDMRDLIEGESVR